MPFQSSYSLWPVHRQANHWRTPPCMTTNSARNLFRSLKLCAPLPAPSVSYFQHGMRFIVLAWSSVICKLYPVWLVGYLWKLITKMGPINRGSSVFSVLLNELSKLPSRSSWELASRALFGFYFVNVHPRKHFRFNDIHLLRSFW